MISKITLSNFKCFRNAAISIAPLTVLTGYNGTGKSTLAQTLLLLKQTIESRQSIAQLKGYWIDLGSFKDILSFFSEEEEICIGFSNSSGSASLSIGPRVEFNTGHANEHKLLKTIADNVYSLSADRITPKDSYPMYDADPIADVPHVGRNGEYSAHYLDRHGSRPIKNPDMDLGQQITGRRLSDYLNSWLRRISPGVSISAKSVSATQSAYLQYKFDAGSMQTDFIRAQNVGFGLTYTLPVLLTLIDSLPGEILLIENPEAHIHPAGQSLLGQLIAMVVRSGVCIIVETHSDHIINGVRLGVKNSVLDPKQVIIQYFLRGSAGDTQIDTINMDERGRLDDWPEGFFDEGIKSLSQLNS